jgi:ribosomal protein L18
MIIKRTKIQKKTLSVRDKVGHRIYEISMTKTNQHLYARFYDIKEEKTILTLSTKDIKNLKNTSNKDAAKELGKNFALKIKEKSIENLQDLCFFNKLTYKFHGKVVSFLDEVKANLNLNI